MKSHADRFPPDEGPTQRAPRGCAALLRALLCLLLTLLCRLLGRWIPGLCRLRDRLCEPVRVPPTTALSEPTGCTQAQPTSLVDANGGTHHYPALVEIRGKAFGGTFTGYKLGYRAGSSGPFIETDAAIVYPDTRTNADLGASLYPTPVGSAIADGTLGYLNALLLTEGHYEIQLRAEIGGVTRTLGFDLNREYVEITEVSGMSVPDPADEASQVAHPAGGGIRLTGSADTGGCANRRVDKFRLEVAAGHLTLADTIALPPAARDLILEVDYTTDPVFATMPRPRLGDLTIEIYKATCTITIGGITFSYDCGRTKNKPWGTVSGVIDGFNLDGLNGRYTVLLTVHFSDGGISHDSQQVWLDNRLPVAWISGIEQLQDGTWVDVSGCEPISKANGTMLRFMGVALDPLILATEPATAPYNLNFDHYVMHYTQDGTGSFLPLTPASSGPVGTVNIDPATGRTLLASSSPDVPDITSAGVLAEWDISALAPCAYAVRLRVRDQTVVNSGTTHLGEFTYALTIEA